MSLKDSIEDVSNELNTKNTNKRGKLIKGIIYDYRLKLSNTKSKTTTYIKIS